MKPDHMGCLGQFWTVWTEGGMETWEWIEDPSPLFAVSDEFREVSRGLTRNDAASLAGLLLRNPACTKVSLREYRQGDWVLKSTTPHQEEPSEPAP